MRLYSLTGAASVTAGGTRYEPADDGGFDFPPGLQRLMHAVHVGGQKQWETSIERQHRAAAEELARIRDPATMYAAVAELVAAAKTATQAQAAAEPAPKAEAPAKAATAKAAAKADDSGK